MLLGSKYSNISVSISEEDNSIVKLECAGVASCTVLFLLPALPPPSLTRSVTIEVHLGISLVRPRQGHPGCSGGKMIVLQV